MDNSVDLNRHKPDTVHMKRTNLVLDDVLLKSAKAISECKTYSATVNLALREMIDRRTFARIDSFAGSDVWQGDLATMREDEVSD